MYDSKFYTLTLEDTQNEIFFSTAIDGPHVSDVISEFANAMRSMGFSETTIRHGMREYCDIGDGE